MLSEAEEDLYRILLRDLGSRNATFVNDIRVMGTSKTIKWGDVLRFGYDRPAYRLVKFEDLHKQESKELPPPSIPAHQVCAIQP